MYINLDRYKILVELDNEIIAQDTISGLVFRFIKDKEIQYDGTRENEKV